MMGRRRILFSSMFLLLLPNVTPQFFDFFGFPPITHQTLRPLTQITIEQSKSRKTQQTTKQPIYFHDDTNGDSDRPYVREKQRKQTAPTTQHSNSNGRQTSYKSNGSRSSSGRIQESSYEIEYEISYENRLRNISQPLAKNDKIYYTVKPVFETTTKPYNTQPKKPAKDNEFYNNPNTNDNRYNNNDSNHYNNRPDRYTTSKPASEVTTKFQNTQSSYNNPNNYNDYNSHNKYDTNSNNYNNRPDRYTTRKPAFEVTTKFHNTQSSNNNDYYNNPNNNNNYNSHNSYDINSNNYNNRPGYTTKNPFYNRPGVKPPVIESSKPITNRPITNRPATNRPTTKRTVTKRPYVVNPRPKDDGAISFPDNHDLDVAPEVLPGPDEDNMSASEKRRYIELSEKMCDEYKSLNTRPIQAIPLLPSPQPVQVNVSSCTPINIPLVVGGTVVSVRDFPHMALLGWVKLEGGYSWKCGGSLISGQYVLTAAHCAYQERDNTVLIGPPRVAQLGSSYLDDPGALVVKLSTVYRHPKYKQPKSYYDIALVKLQSTVKFSEVIRPACLGEPPGTGQPIIATGWGQTEFAGDQSLELRSVSLPIWDMDRCRNVLGTSRKLPEGPSSYSQICAGETRGGKDTCQGDSGGPAQLQDGCLWRVVAVTSLGRSCGAPNTPGLYARVHRAFIAAQVFGALKNNNDNKDSENAAANDRFENRDRDRRNDKNRPAVSDTTRYDNNSGNNYGTTRYDSFNNNGNDNDNGRENKYNSYHVQTYDKSRNNYDNTNNENNRYSGNNDNSNQNRQVNNQNRRNNRENFDNGRIW